MRDVEGARDFTAGGDAYDRFMGRYSQLLAPLFVDLCGVEAGQRLVDVGCGPGAFTNVAVDRLGAEAVVAVDPAPSFVAACRERLPGVDVRQGVGEDLPLEDDAVDRAVAQLVLHFVTDAPRTVAEMRRVTRPGGIVGACVWDAGAGMGLLHVVRSARAMVEPPEEGAPIAFGRPGELGALLGAAALDDVEESTLTVTVDYPGFDVLWDSLLEGVGPAGAWVVSLKPEVRDRFRVALHEQVGRPEGGFSLSGVARAARGVVRA